jgi:hypothetical protein
VTEASRIKATPVFFSLARSSDDEKSVGNSGLVLFAKKVPHGNMYGIMLHKRA